jgi:hypothetical protein
MTEETPTTFPEATNPAEIKAEMAQSPTAKPAPAEPPLASVHATPRPASAAQAAPSTTPLLGAVVALTAVVVIGGFILWRSTSSLSTQLAQTQAQLASLDARIGKLEARPDPTPDLRPLQQRLTTLEQKPPPQAQLDAAGQQQLASLAGRVDGITARQDQLGVRSQQDTEKLTADIAALNTKLAAVSQTGTQITALASQQTLTSRLQIAAAALAAGRPVGDIPGAPPALARFATKAPPTEASLRLSFDEAAEAARRAGQPAPANAPFFDRLWARAQSSVVVRQGDKVIVGDPLSTVIEQARRQLDAGDLAGAVSALAGLTGPAATAMAPWRGEAQSLLDARAALISAARG